MQDQALAISENLIVGGYGRIDGDLPVFTGSTWEDHVQAWIDAESEVTTNRWKQAAVAASLESHYGDQSLEKFAQQIGVHVVRIREYRRAYNLYRQIDGRPSNLDFTHYVLASSSDTPEEMIEIAAQESLSTRQLSRLVKQQKAPPIDASTATSLSDNEQIQAKWAAFRAAAQELLGVAPHITNAVKVALEEIEYELSRPSETNREAIFNALSEGYDEIDEIAKRIHKHRDYVLVWMNRLEEEGAVRSFEKERAPTARGQRRTGWEIV